MKTAATVLQEMMVKLGETPHFDCTAQRGPQHQALFEYRCTAHGAVAVAVGRSKKEARQEVSRRVLAKLAAQGLEVPAPWGAGAAAAAAAAAGEQAATLVDDGCTRKGVALLRDLCDEYRLGVAEYELVGDAGPPHQRHFTMRASLGPNARTATATTKKAARQLAAHHLYCYLRDNLARLTGEIDEAESLARMHERAMERYSEQRDAAAAPKPHLGQRIADYHVALRLAHDEAAVLAARRALQAHAGQPGAAVAAAAAALGLGCACTPRPPLHLLELAPSAPALLFAGLTPERAAQNAERYLRLALDDP